MMTLVTLSGDCFTAKYEEVGRAENREGVLFYFTLNDLTKNRGPRYVRLFLAGPERLYVENLDERLETVRINTIRRAFDSGTLDFVSPVEEGLGCKEIPLRARDFLAQPEASVEQLRRFLKLGGYWIGFNARPNAANTYVDFDCALDLEYLGTTSQTLARHLWFLSEQGYFRSHPGTLMATPTHKLVEEMENRDDGGTSQPGGKNLIQNIHFHGPNSRVNMNSVDGSVNLSDGGHMHARRVDALLTICSKLEEALAYLQRAAAAGKFEGQASDTELLRRMAASLAAASEAFSSNSLLISESLGLKIDAFFNKMRSGGIEMSMALNPMVADGEPRARYWDGAREIAYKDAPAVLKAIKDEARAATGIK